MDSGLEQLKDVNIRTEMCSNIEAVEIAIIWTIYVKKHQWKNVVVQSEKKFVVAALSLLRCKWDSCHITF